MLNAAADDDAVRVFLRDLYPVWRTRSLPQSILGYNISRKINFGRLQQ